MSPTLGRTLIVLTTVLGFAAPLTQQLVERAHCETPNPKWVRFHNTLPGISAVNILAMTNDGVLAWNGTPITWPLLQRYVAATREMNPIPLLVFRPAEGASCSQKARVRGLMSRLLPCEEGRCGEGAAWSDFTQSGPGDIY